jgi:CRP/FNR family transcriptional regulator, cyclic AMP receptor protein
LDLPANRVPAWPVSSFIGQLKPSTSAAILQRGTLKPIRLGEILFSEGGEPDCVFVLLSGWYSVIGSTENGKEALLAIRGCGDVVGELGIVDGYPRSASVKASTLGKARRIGRQEWLGILEQYSDAALAMSGSISAKLRSATRRRLEFATCPANVRVARVIRELATTHGVVREDGATEVRVSITQPDLAALIGATEPTVHRILSIMREAQVISTGYRRIAVLDPARLDSLADPD